MPINHPLTIVSTIPASVVIPNSGAFVTANSVEIFTQSLANWCQALTDGKIVVKAGVTFLGDVGCAWTNNGATGLASTSCTDLTALTVVATGGTVASVTGTGVTNGAGVKGQGAGSGPGVTGTGGPTGTGVLGQGGSTSGVGVTGVGGVGTPGVRGTGGSGGASGVDAIGTSGAHGTTSLGSGAGHGVVGTGGASGGAGLKGIAGTGGVGIECGAGNMKFTGTQPVSTADPGANNYACGTNMPKAWAHVSVVPSGGVGVVTVDDAYNIASITAATDHLVVTFARPMASINYAVTYGIEYWDDLPWTVKVSASVFQIWINQTSVPATTFPLGSGTGHTLSFNVAARQ